MCKNFVSEKLELREAGLKVTMPRISILELFENSSQRHLSADDIYMKLVESNKAIGIATVYRVLTQFEKAGILNKHNFGNDHAVFELNSDDHHDHLMCIECGKVKEFFNAEIEDLQTKIAENENFKITDHSLIIYGVCNNCK